MAETRDLLAIHETEATFTGLQHLPCHFRTALCPSECGHASDCAVFAVTKYISWEKPGEYGDDKTDQFHFNLTRMPGGQGQEEFKAVVATLKAGDAVLLSWRHDYVHCDGVSSPQRPVTKLVKL